ncbi:MAG: hypothetical protein ABFS86_13820 [Planctomycetota bacterium]
MFRGTMVLLALLVLAAPSFGGETEDRFHAAYAKEVVEGDVKGAALEYLALMDDNGADDRLRAEARFRFAVCAVLPGRSDEARSHLKGLADAEGLVPPDIRKKAKEYLSSISGIGVGTELDKRLRELVFDLGRAGPADSSVTPGVYRDFEIIGKQSLPFLRKLLHHSDADLRRHAYRILCRMREPGMAAAWNPDLGLRGRSFCGDLYKYLGADPAELAAFEKRILEFGEEGISRVAYMSPWPSFSLGFVRKLAAIEKWKYLAVGFAVSSADSVEGRDVLARWLDGEDEELSRRVVSNLLDRKFRFPDDYMSEPRFAVLVQRLIELGSRFSSQGGHGAQNRDTLRPWLERASPAAALAQLEVVMAHSESLTGWPRKDPVMSGLATELAERIGGSLPDDVDAVKYADLLKRWLAVQRNWFHLSGQRDRDLPPAPDSALQRHFQQFVRHASPEAARELARWIVTGPGKGNCGSTWWNFVFFVRSVRDVEVLFATMRAAAPGDRLNLARRIWETLDGAAKLAWAKGIGDLAAVADARLAVTLFDRYPYLSRELPPQASREALRAILRLIPKLDKGVRNEILGRVIGDAAPAEYVTGTLLAVVPEFWDSLPERWRAKCLDVFVGLVASVRSGSETDTGIEDLAGFLRKHIAEIPQPQYWALFRYRDLFPPEEWIRYVPNAYAMEWGTVPVPERYRIARALGEDLSDVTKSEVSFILDHGRWEGASEVFTRGVKLEDRGRRALFLIRISKDGPLSPKAKEELLLDTMAEEKPDLAMVRRLARVVLAVRPSELLFPAARMLISSDDRDNRLEGILIAASLGREDLVPDLVKLLDSMDAGLRTKAKEAIDAIREVQRIKDEEALKKAGLVPK